MTRRELEAPDDKKFVADPRVRIGHVHLKVADLARALEFYCAVLGFTLMQRFWRGRGVYCGGRLPFIISG